jgi:hypothetical protein
MSRKVFVPVGIEWGSVEQYGYLQHIKTELVTWAFDLRPTDPRARWQCQVR